MHPAEQFVERDRAALAHLIDEVGFGVVVGCGPAGPLAAHAPVLLHQGRARFHLAASNSLSEVLRDTHQTALVVITGPDTYVSPDWYGAPDQVPTWNYLSAEIEGTVRVTDRIATAALLDDLAARFEAALAPKPPWSRTKMAPGRFEAMLGAIVGFEIEIIRLEGVRKLSQNKTSAQMEGVATALAASSSDRARQIGLLMTQVARSRKD